MLKNAILVIKTNISVVNWLSVILKIGFFSAVPSIINDIAKNLLLYNAILQFCNSASSAILQFCNSAILQFCNSEILKFWLDQMRKSDRNYLQILGDRVFQDRNKIVWVQ